MSAETDNTPSPDDEPIERLRLSFSRLFRAPTATYNPAEARGRVRCKCGDLVHRPAGYRLAENKIRLLRKKNGDGCAICSLPCYFRMFGRKKNASPVAPSIDHIVPRRYGGCDCPKNLRITHRYCNMLRSEVEDEATFDANQTVAEECRKVLAPLLPKRLLTVSPGNR